MLKVDAYNCKAILINQGRRQTGGRGERTETSKDPCTCVPCVPLEDRLGGGAYPVHSFISWIWISILSHS